MTEDLPCRELVELVTDHLEDALPAAVRLRLEEHLLGCEGCVEHVEQVRHTVALLHAMPREDLSPQARERVVQAFRAWRDGEGGPGGDAIGPFPPRGIGPA